MKYRRFDNEELTAALKEVALSTREAQMPAEAEPRLRAAFRQRHASMRTSKRKTPYGLLTLAAAIACILFTAKIWVGSTGVHAVVAVPVPQFSFRLPDPPDQEEIILAKHSVQPAAGNPTEVVSDFVSLGYSGPAPEAYQVVRVKMDRTSLAQYGFPVNPDRSGEPLDADLLIGEDGVPRAVRFVNQVSYNPNLP